MYRIMPSSNRDILISSFLPFISFSCPIALDRTSSTILNMNGQNGQSCIVPDFSENALNFSPFRILVICLSYIAFLTQNSSARYEIPLGELLVK